MKPSPAAMRKKAALVARQLNAGCATVTRKYVKPEPKQTEAAAS